MGYPASYPNWVFSLFALIGFIIVSIPFPWHLEGEHFSYSISLTTSGSVYFQLGILGHASTWLGLPLRA